MVTLGGSIFFRESEKEKFASPSSKMEAQLDSRDCIFISLQATINHDVLHTDLHFRQIYIGLYTGIQNELFLKEKWKNKNGSPLWLCLNSVKSMA